jgi:hypothetical protein
LPARGHREIDLGEARGGALQRCFARFDGALELAFERVGGCPDGPPLLGIETGKGLQDFGERTRLAAEELGLDLLEAAFVCVRDFLETLPQRV